MSTKIINLPFVQLVLKRISDYTLNHQSGLDDVPHLCVKVKHNNGYAWFGVNILNHETRAWSSFEVDEMKARFLEAINKLCDVIEIVTDVSRLMESIQDVVTGRKRPTFFGGHGNDMIQMHTINNVQLDVYREDINSDTMSYGGFAAEVRINGQDYPLFLYHRGVILYHYINEVDAKRLIVDSLTNNFGELFENYEVDEQHVNVFRVVERTRNKNRNEADSRTIRSLTDSRRSA
ncbi:hypothetical protein [Pseudomonas phage PA1C]|uniref:Uncharacterized protein n=1 Tax=Pseudomonas phage vB_PaeM_PS119XW TaxID=2601632 RepID=A0A5C1K967_9CAUD|nr:hypothetical protein PP933_gp364 [Pseudomonas phage vB_PaeM_PS119XW]QBX32520.1 hypothetical protein [Pseudomonas phage PA1C]QEM42093.1 hypothetical protein [Pseudomonas phage vB_PaeM_PS119XW]BEG72606.1 hypothetical protein RVBP21_2340 [Pseudomonas phage BRkr]